MGGVFTPCNHKGCSALTALGDRYCDEHKTQHAWARAEKKTTTERGYGAQWRRLRSMVLNREPLCRACKAEGHIVSATDVDHIRPKAKGGGDEMSNLQPLCKSCHMSKTGKES